MSTTSEPKSVLFVCLGNICRSPLAEAVFAHLCTERGLTDRIKWDSAGTAGYHVGELPDPRSIATCKAHNIPINSRCRQLSVSDFDNFDVIVGMDESNMRNILSLQPRSKVKAKVALFGSYGDGKVITDPYYGGDSGFEKTYKQCLRYSEGLLKELVGEEVGEKL